VFGRLSQLLLAAVAISNEKYGMSWENSVPSLADASAELSQLLREDRPTSPDSAPPNSDTEEGLVAR